jgi:site-specific DNA recombinase
MDGQVKRTTLEQEEATAPVVQRIFRELLGGMGAMEIAKGLNKDGILGPVGKSWSKNSVYGIATNEAMTGTLVWGKRGKKKSGSHIRADNAWAPIVDKDTFRKVQSILALRSPKITRPRSVTSEYLLGGIMKCAECGSAMVGSAAKSHRFFYYRCANALKRRPDVCPGRWLPRQRIEHFVIDRIKDYILTDNNLRELMSLINEEIDTLANNESNKLAMIDQQLKDVDSRLERLYDALEAGKLELNDLSPRISSLISRRSQLQQARKEAQAAILERKLGTNELELMRSYVIDLKNVLGSASIMEQKTFLKSFVRRIDVGSSNILYSRRSIAPTFILYTANRWADPGLSFPGSQLSG